MQLYSPERIFKAVELSIVCSLAIYTLGEIWPSSTCNIVEVYRGNLTGFICASPRVDAEEARQSKWETCQLKRLSVSNIPDWRISDELLRIIGNELRSQPSQSTPKPFRIGWEFMYRSLRHGADKDWMEGVIVDDKTGA